MSYIGSASPSIGSPVSGGTANEVLFIGPTGLLAQSPNFKYHGITTGDFNKLDMGTDGRVILQSGNLDPGTGGSESSTILQMTDASTLNYFSTIEGGLTFGATFQLDDHEGQFDFVTTQNGDPRLDMWGFFNAKVNYIACDPGQCGQDQGSAAANVAWQKANNPARITVDGDLYAGKNNPNRYGRNFILTGESNNNGGTGGDIVLIPGLGDSGQLAGNVGIGTLSPYAKLDVKQTSGNFLVQPSIQLSNGISFATVNSNNTANTGLEFRSSDIFFNSVASGIIKFGVETNTPALSIDTSNSRAHFTGGQVYFGDGTFLNLNASGGYMLATSAAGNAGFTANRDALGQYVSFDLLSSGSVSTGWSFQMQPSDTNGYIVDRVAATNIMSFVTGGSVGINNSSPSYNLDVSGTFRATGNATFDSASYFGDVMTLTVGDFFITNGDMHIGHGVYDGAASAGSTGSVLMSGGSGIIWKASAYSDLTAQGAAITATTLYAVPSTGLGLYRVSYVATVTRAATTSCVLGGTNGFQLKFTDPTDSVVKTSNPTTVVSSSVNATGTTISGTLLAYCKASTNLQYLFDYTSVGGTSMQYDLHIKVEAI